MEKVFIIILILSFIENIYNQANQGKTKTYRQINTEEYVI